MFGRPFDFLRGASALFSSKPTAPSASRLEAGTKEGCHSEGSSSLLAHESIVLKTRKGQGAAHNETQRALSSSPVPDDDEAREIPSYISPTTPILHQSPVRESEQTFDVPETPILFSELIDDRGLDKAECVAIYTVPNLNVATTRNLTRWPKPIGYAGRSRSGGYNLETEMRTRLGGSIFTEKTYKEFRVSLLV